MTYIKISKKRIAQAVKENDSILLAHFHPNNRTPIKTRQHIKCYDPFVTLDGKKYTVKTKKCHNIYWII